MTKKEKPRPDQSLFAAISPKVVFCLFKYVETCLSGREMMDNAGKIRQARAASDKIFADC